MKEIKLEKYEIKVEGVTKPVEIDEANFVFSASRYKPQAGQNQKGFSYNEFKEFARIDDALKEADKTGILKLEEADFDKLFERLKKTEWGNASKEMVKAVLKVVEKFEAAKEKKKEKA